MHGGELLRLRQRRTPKTHALRFHHGDALRLSLPDELPLCLGHIAEQLQDNVGDQGPGEISVLPGIQQGHIQHHDGCALLLGDDPPLLQNFVVIPTQPVNALPLFVLFFRGNSRITIFHQNQPPSNVFSKHIVRLPPTAGTSLREPVGGDVNSGGAVVQVFSAYSGALTSGGMQVCAEGLVAIGGGIDASIAFV